MSSLDAELRRAWPCDQLDLSCGGLDQISPEPVFEPGQQQSFSEENILSLILTL